MVLTSIHEMHTYMCMHKTSRYTYEWILHTKSIWKVKWVHLEFRKILASCSYDCSVCIWEYPTQLSNENILLSNSDNQNNNIHTNLNHSKIT